MNIYQGIGTGSLSSTFANALRATSGSLTGTSNTFTREAGATAFFIAANSIAYDGATDRLYASTNSGTIVPIRPNGSGSDAPITVSTGVVGQIEVLNGVLYVAIEGGTKIVKVDLATRAVGTPFALGSSFGSNWTAVDFAILPNDPATIGVILNYVSSGDPKVAVYTDGVRRSTVIAYDPFSSTGPNFQEITNAGASNRLYAKGSSSAGSVLHLLDVTASGITLARSYTVPGALTNLMGSGALLIGDGGYVIEGETGNVRGRIGVTNGAPSGSFLVDEATGRATLLARRTSYYADPWDVRVFDLASFADLGGTQAQDEPLSVPYTYPTLYTPAVRVGARSVAFRGGSTVEFVPTPLILPVATPQPDLAVQQINAPANASAGQPVSFNMLVRNMGTAPAANVTLTSSCTNSAPFLSASTTQGTLTQNGATVSAQLGTLAPGDAATVCVVLTARAGGNTNSMTVTTSTPEPHTLNNLSSLTISPPTYADPLPKVNLTTTDLASSKVTQRVYAPLGLRQRPVQRHGGGPGPHGPCGARVRARGQRPGPGGARGERDRPARRPRGWHGHAGQCGHVHRGHRFHPWHGSRREKTFRQGHGRPHRSAGAIPHLPQGYDGRPRRCGIVSKRHPDRRGHRQCRAQPMARCRSG